MAAVLARPFPMLRCFALQDCYGGDEEDVHTRQSPNAILAVAAACPRLKTLHISGNGASAAGVLEEGLLAPSSHGILQQKLTCYSLASAGVVSGIAAHGRTLTDLTLTVQSVSEIPAVAGSCRALVHLPMTIVSGWHEGSTFARNTEGGPEAGCLEDALVLLPCLESLSLYLGAPRLYAPALRAIGRAPSPRLKRLTVHVLGSSAPPVRYRRGQQRPLPEQLISAAIHALLTRCPLLETLFLSGELLSGGAEEEDDDEEEDWDVDEVLEEDEGGVQEDEGRGAGEGGSSSEEDEEEKVDVEGVGCSSVPRSVCHPGGGARSTGALETLMVTLPPTPSRARVYVRTLLACCPALKTLGLITTTTPAAVRAALAVVQRRRHLARGLRSLTLSNGSTVEDDDVDPGRIDDQGEDHDDDPNHDQDLDQDGDQDNAQNDGDYDAAVEGMNLGGDAGVVDAELQAGDNAGAGGAGGGGAGAVPALLSQPLPPPGQHHLDLQPTDEGNSALGLGLAPGLGLRVGAMELPGLEVLKLHNYHVSDADIEVIAGGCPRLQKLSIEHRRQLEALTGAGFAGGPGLPHLLVLEVTGLRSTGIAGVAVGCPNLRELRALLSSQCSEGARRAYTRVLTGLMLAQRAHAGFPSPVPTLGCWTFASQQEVPAPNQRGGLRKLTFSYDAECEWGPFAEAVVDLSLKQFCDVPYISRTERGDDDDNDDDEPDLQLTLMVQIFEARGISQTF